MRKINMMIACLTMLGLVAACGEGFKAAKTDISSETGGNNIQEQVLVEEEAAVAAVGETPVSVDQSILNSYSSEFNNISSNLISQLAGEIKAFELNITSSMSSSNVNLALKMNLSCNQQMEFRKSVSLNELTSGAKISLGFQGLYDVRVQCANNNCSEMVAAVKKSNRQTDVVVLIGLKEAGNSTTPSTATTRYISRSVSINPQFASGISSVNVYTLRCGREAQMATSSGTGTIIDPTSGVTSGTQSAVVTPTPNSQWNWSQGPL